MCSLFTLVNPVIFSVKLGGYLLLKHCRNKENSKPKFCKPRQVPFALKEPLERELTRLEGLGILQKIKHTEWAAPVVVVPKGDGCLRVCGDYK